jgi:GPH family glycoside/pentoside/hexuronide:cation symporter
VTKPAAPAVATASDDAGAGGTPATAAGDRLSPRELSAYGAGIIAYQYPHYGLAQLAMPLFNVTLGVAPAQVGGVLMLGRIWDAVLNPLVGTLSDNTRSRWGRRRPWLVAGAVLSGLAYPLVWLAPRHWSGDALSVWLLVSCLLLYTAFAAYSVPYMALGLELTPDTRERTRVQAWRTWFNLIPIFTAGWFYWFCQRPIFGDALTGSRWLGLIVGVVIIGTGVIPGLFLRERYYRVAASAGREPFWPAAFAALRNRPFLLVMGIIVTVLCVRVSHLRWRHRGGGEARGHQRGRHPARRLPRDSARAGGGAALGKARGVARLSLGLPRRRAGQVVARHARVPVARPAHRRIHPVRNDRFLDDRQLHEG